jgi:glutaconate CoA-transferase, subunit B
VLPDIFDLARQGSIDTMFFGAAQIDAGARLNLTSIGDPRRPKVKLPGPAGSSSVRPLVRRVIVMAPRHTPRTFVERVDFATSAPAPANRETWIVTDLSVLRLHEDGRLRLAALRAGVTSEEVRAATGFPLAGEGTEDPAEESIASPPSPAEREALDRIDPGGTRYRLA